MKNYNKAFRCLKLTAAGLTDAEIGLVLRVSRARVGQLKKEGNEKLELMKKEEEDKNE